MDAHDCLNAVEQTMQSRDNRAGFAVTKISRIFARVIMQLSRYSAFRFA